MRFGRSSSNDHRIKRLFLCSIKKKGTNSEYEANVLYTFQPEILIDPKMIYE